MASSESVFAKIPSSEWLHESEHYFVGRRPLSVSPGHCLIISKQPRADFFELSQPERHELTEVVVTVRAFARWQVPARRLNIGMNCGVAAGQTVIHFHCHVIPRYEGDMTNPAAVLGIVWRGKGITN